MVDNVKDVDWIWVDNVKDVDWIWVDSVKDVGWIWVDNVKDVDFIYTATVNSGLVTLCISGTDKLCDIHKGGSSTGD